MPLSYRRKTHEPGANGSAVFDGNLYLGDVTPTRDGWIGHPAGEEQRLPFTWASRSDAAKALRRYRETSAVVPGQ